MALSGLCVTVCTTQTCVEGDCEDCELPLICFCVDSHCAMLTERFCTLAREDIYSLLMCTMSLTFALNVPLGLGLCACHHAPVGQRYNLLLCAVAHSYTRQRVLPEIFGQYPVLQSLGPHGWCSNVHRAGYPLRWLRHRQHGAVLHGPRGNGESQTRYGPAQHCRSGLRAASGLIHTQGSRL